MRNEILNWRLWVISILAMVALICIVSEPANDETWFMDFFVSKSIGFGTAYLTYRLARYWEKNNLISISDEDEEV